MYFPLERPFFEPFVRLGQQFAQILPWLITVSVILVVGGVVAAIVRRLVAWLLGAVHFDRLAAKSELAHTMERTGIFRSASDFVARLVQSLLWLIIILAALSAIDSALTQALVERFVNYIPALITAALILLFGSAVSRFLARSALLAAVNAQWAGARAIAAGVRILVMTMAVAVALEELHIGRTFVLMSFAILFSGIVIAGAIAFGLGARDIARNWMQSKIQKNPAEDEEIFHHL